MIEQLKAALAISPDNLPLRKLVLQHYLDAEDWKNAEEHLLKIMDAEQLSNYFRFYLAKAYLNNDKPSACIIVLEDLIQEENNADYHLVYAKALAKENLMKEALIQYEHATHLKPSIYDSELQGLYDLSQFHNTVEMNSIEPPITKPKFGKPEIDFSAIGGLEAVKEEIRLKIIHPFQHPEIYKAYGKKAGGGILLYGPPGCGKSLIARATAGEMRGSFFPIGINDILDMWLGNSEKNIHQVFNLARSNTPCVLFFDEVDALAASRSDLKHTNAKNIINQFLDELDGVKYSNDGILVLAATNAPWNMDPAFKRPGRFDKLVFVGPPGQVSRESILTLILKSIPQEGLNLFQMATLTEGFSGADLRALVDVAVDSKIAESLSKGYAVKLTNNDLLFALKKQKASTIEWLNLAKNYALHANATGHYDDILKFFNLKK